MTPKNTGQCGPALTECSCRYPRPREQAEVDAAHRQSVRRARQSGFAEQPVPGWVIAVLLPSATRQDEKAA